MRDEGSTPGLGRSPGEGNGKPLQYSCVENATDRRAWQTTDRRVAQSWTELQRLSTHVWGILVLRLGVESVSPALADS